MIKEFTGDILKSDEKIILHQVNCKGVMGAGIAKQIRDKYPEVYADYRERCFIYFCNLNGITPLGTILSSKTMDGKTICNLFAQNGYSKENCQTDYNALKSCLEKVNDEFYGETVAIPYKMSCGLAGGDWSIVRKMIEDTLVDCEVHIYKLEGAV